MDSASKFKKLINTQRVRANLGGRSVRAAAFTSAASGIDFIIRLGSTAILARLLLPEHFGLVMMVTAIIAIAEQLRDLGLATATVQKKDISYEEVTNLFWINVAVSALLAAIICATSPLIAHYYQDSRLILITCVLSANCLLGGLMVQHQALLTRQLKLGNTSAIRLGANVLSTMAAVILAWQDFGYWSLVFREVIRNALLVGGMYVSLPWIPGLPSRKTNIRGLLGFGAHLTAANIVGSISASADRLLLGRFMGAVPVGLYRQAHQLMAAPTDQLVSPIYQVAQPGLSILQSEPERFRQLYSKVVTMVCCLTMPLSLFVAIYASDVVTLMLGPNWSAAAPVIAILCIGTFIKQAVGSSALLLISLGRTKRYFVLSVAHNIALIASMCVGIKWGINGIAVAEVVTIYLMIFPRLYYATKDSPVSLGSIVRSMARPATASFVMAISLGVIQSQIPGVSAWLSLLLGSIVGTLSFCATWLLLPGGRVEISTLITDVRSALGRKLLKSSAAPG